MVGDAGTDVGVARRASVPVIGVTFGYTETPIEELKPDRVISRMTDLYVAPHNTPLTRQRDPATRDQAVVDNGAREFAKAFSFVSHYMGPGPFSAGDAPSIGDFALAPFIIMLKQTVFCYYKEIPDPTVADARIKTWWQAMQKHAACREACDEYDAALAKFLIWLRERMAARS